jgi:hypothetical protein
MSPWHEVPPKCSKPGCERLAEPSDLALRCWWCGPNAEDQCTHHGLENAMRWPGEVEAL